VLRISSLPFSTVISLQMEPKRRFWLGKLSTEWWERPSEVNMGTSESENEMKDTNPAREVNAKGKDDILGDSTNNIRLECQEW